MEGLFYYFIILSYPSAIAWYHRPYVIPCANIFCGYVQFNKSETQLLIETRQLQASLSLHTYGSRGQIKMPSHSNSTYHTFTGIQVSGFWREAKKLACTVRRQTGPRYACGASANFVPTRNIFCVQYNTKKHAARYHADER